MTIYFRTPALTEGVSSGPEDTFDATLPSRSVGDTMYAILTSDVEFIAGTDPDANWAQLTDVWGGAQAGRVLYRQATLDARDELPVVLNDAGNYRALVLATVGRTYPELATSGVGAGSSAGAQTVGPITPAVNAAAKVVTVVSLAGTSTLPTSTQGGATYTDTTPDAYAYWITPEAGPFTIDLPARDGHARLSFRIYQAVVTYATGTADNLTHIGGVEYPELPYGNSSTPFNSRGYAAEGPKDGPFTQSEAAALLDQANAEHDTNTVVNVIRNAPLVWSTDSGAGIPVPWEQWAASNHDPIVVDPALIEDGTDGQGNRLWSPEEVTPPPGTLGWEWPDGNNPGQSRPAALVDVLLNVTSDFGNYDGTVGTTLPFSTVLYAQTGGVTFTGDDDGISAWGTLSGVEVGRYTTELLEPDRMLVSVVDHLNDDKRVLVYAQAPAPGEVIDGPADPTATSQQYLVGNSPQYGFYDGETVYWVYDPPPFRWITSFTEITGAPALRLYPRDGDGRGLGGVTRIYPRPRSRRLYGHQP